MTKYHAIKTEIDGIVFDSRKEAGRYQELKILERSGIIRGLELQVPFDLHAWNPDSGTSAKVGRYIADFVYQDQQGRTCVEDVKGMATPLYKWKKKHAEAQYGIRIIEI